MRRQQQFFFDAGCDQVIGHGTHWSGPIEIGADADGGDHVTMVSHGNFLFGQEWSQQTQEGVILELAFRGTELAQARMHPYIMLEQAQTNLTDPSTRWAVRPRPDLRGVRAELRRRRPDLIPAS